MKGEIAQARGNHAQQSTISTKAILHGMYLPMLWVC